MIILEILTYTLVAWLGAYLLVRVSGSQATRWSGLGIIAYALVIAAGSLSSLAAAPPLFDRAWWALLALPPYFWGIAVLQLRRAGTPPHRANRAAAPILGAAAAVLLVFLTRANPTPEAGSTGQTFAFWLLAGWSLLPIAASLSALRAANRAGAEKKALIAIASAALFFTAGIALLLFQPIGLPRSWVLVAIAFDFELLGFAVARLDAFDLGETLLPDFLRSLFVSSLLALLFGAQVAFGMAISTGVTYEMVLLLYLTITAAVLVGNTFDILQAFAERQILQITGGAVRDFDLRAASRAVVRKDHAAAPDQMDEESLFRHTRRALSDYGSLPRLISNPLTQMKWITDRLALRNAPDSPLERAQLLKLRLAESVMRLKPRSEESFGDTDEWRYFNALYFPYIQGLKVYSRQTDPDSLDPDVRAALAWFRASVPERTLHNWQNAAARLVMQDLFRPE